MHMASSDVTWKSLVIIFVDMDRGYQDLYIGSGVARAFPGGRLAHPAAKNEEENK